MSAPDPIESLRAQLAQAQQDLEILRRDMRSLKGTYRLYRTGFWLLLLALCVAGFFQCRTSRESATNVGAAY